MHPRHLADLDEVSLHRTRPFALKTSIDERCEIWRISGTQAVHLSLGESQLPCSRLRLGTCRHAELLHAMGDMYLHGRKHDVQDLANSGI